MRLFSIRKDGVFKEYLAKPFHVKHEESVLENWLETNPDGIVEDGKLLIIGRQINTNLGGFIDLMALDRDGNTVVIELKRDRTPRETLAQALEYASFVESLELSDIEGILRAYTNDEAIKVADYHREYFHLESDEAAAFNKEQRIVIVGQRVTNEIRQTSNFLRQKGVRVTCIEFSFFETESGFQLLSHDIVVGKEPSKPSKISSASLPVVSKQEFLKSLDDFGRPVFEKILEFGEENKLPVHWGTKGFSLNVDIEERHVVVCYGYPPNSVFSQSVYTALYGRGGLLSKIAASEADADKLYAAAQKTGLFQKAGKELKCLFNRQFAENEMGEIFEWIGNTVRIIKERGLRD